MDPPKKLRVGAYEGVPHPSRKSEINNQALHLIYKTHIPKDKYRQWFNEYIIPTYCKGGKLEFLEIAHEGPDYTNDCNHTHVVIIVTTTIRTRKRRIFNWPSQSRFADEHGNLRPAILVLKRADEIESAKHMLGDEDPEYSDYHRQYAKYKKRPEISMAIEIPSHFRNLRCKVPHLVGWQKQAYRLMESPTPNRVNYIYDHTQRSGKMTLLAALDHRDPIHYRIILNNGPDLRYNIERTPMLMDDVWDGSVLILNLLTGPRSETVPAGVVYCLLKAGQDSSCKSIWIISNSLPTSLDTMDVSKIDFYMICSVPTAKVMSDLQPLSYNDALDIWKKRDD